MVMRLGEGDDKKMVMRLGEGDDVVFGLGLRWEVAAHRSIGEG